MYSKDVLHMWLGLIIGFFIGLICGFMGSALATVSKQREYEDKLWQLERERMKMIYESRE